MLNGPVAKNVAELAQSLASEFDDYRQEEIILLGAVADARYDRGMHTKRDGLA